MKICILIFVLLTFLIMPVAAMEFTAPSAPDAATPYMPEEQENFAQGLLYILKTAILKFRPELSNVTGMCLSLVCAILFISMLNSLSQDVTNSIRLIISVVIGMLLLSPTNSIIKLGTSTVTQLSEYGKLLLPVMTAAAAAQGGTTSSAALYTATVFFDTLLTTMISRLIVPALYIYLCLCVANSALEQDVLKKIRDFVKWGMTWCLKIILYVFTGYISITGVISGVVDKSALKAAKLTISGMVPVVGSILSDASETILLSAGVMKSAAGVYGIFAIFAICVGPFFKNRRAIFAYKAISRGL